MNSYILRLRGHGRDSCEGIASHSTTGIRVVKTDRQHTRFPRRPDLIIRWGCTLPVPTDNVVNTGRAIGTTSDKAGFRRILDPKELCPKTYFRGDVVPFVGDVRYVVRPRQHEQGNHLYVARTPAELARAWDRVGADGYASVYVPKVAEYRVFVVSGRAICVAVKTPDDPTDVAWNHADGALFKNVRFAAWPLKAVRVSIEAFLLSGLDFGAVDVMVGADGRCYVLEINTAPALESEYRQRCFAKAFDYIVAHGKAVIPLVKAKGRYLKFVHPAVDAGAMV